MTFRGNKKHESQILDDDLPDENENSEDFIDIKTFVADAVNHATYHVERFFQTVSQAIPRQKLLDPSKISQVLNTSISKGVRKAYSVLEKTLDEEELEECRRTGESTSDIRLVNETLNTLAKAGVPRQYAGGILLMYLEFIEGVEF